MSAYGASHCSHLVRSGILIVTTAVLLAGGLAGCSQSEKTAVRRDDSGKSLKPGCIDLNDATAEQLESLPGIGVALSRRIIEFRDRHGRFRRPEEIIIVDGISEQKFRVIEDRICVRPSEN